VGLLELNRQQSALKNLTIWGGRVKSESAKEERRLKIIKRVSNYHKGTYCTRRSPGDMKNKFMLKSGRVYFILQLNFSVPSRFRKSITKFDVQVTGNCDKCL